MPSLRPPAHPGSDDVDVVVAASLKSLVYGLIAARRSHRPIVWSLHDRVAREYFP